LSDCFDKFHVTRYNDLVIKSFADRETHQLFTTGKSRRLPPDLARRVLRRLEYVDLAIDLNDLTVPRNNRLHALQGAREGQYSISVNDQYRPSRFG
jgi:proteic killer suppression protein